MSLNKTLKKSAKQTLKGHWLSAVAITAIVLLLEMAVIVLEGGLLTFCEYFDITHFLKENIFKNVNFNIQTAIELSVAVLCTLLCFFFLAPILIGEIRWMCKLFDKTPVKICEIFHFYKTPKLYFKSVYLMLTVFLQRLWWGILIFILPITAFAFSSVLIENESAISQGFGIIALVIGTGFFALGIVFFFKIYLDFSLATYVLAKDETISVSKATKISKNTMHKNEGKLFTLKLTLLPFQFIGMLFFPIFLVMPYYNSCHVAFARHFLKEQNSEKQHNMA